MGWGACLLLCGCLPDPMFPDEPTLSFDSFEAMDNGTATMTLGFTDGDGNVGLSQGDTLPPFCATCPHHFRPPLPSHRTSCWAAAPRNQLVCASVEMNSKVEGIFTTGLRP